MSSPVAMDMNYQELNPDVVLEYLLTHPGFLESVVIGPQISRETFQRWTLKRNNKLRRDSRRALLSGYTTPTGRVNSRRILYECSTNRNRLLYELALTCAQIAQADTFELLVRAAAVEEDDPHYYGSNHNSSSDGGGGGDGAGLWLSVIRGDEPGTVKLRRARKQRKPSVHVLKLIDCNEVLLGEVHFFSVVNDRDAQFLQVLSTWGCSMVHFAKLATAKEFPRPTTVISPLPPEDIEYINRQRKLNNFLLDVIKCIFQDIITIDSVILKVMNYAQKLVDADRASLFLVDNKTNEIYARIFDISQELDENGQPKENIHVNQEGYKEIRFPIGKGIAGHVALTGESLNIINAYADERFNREIDSKTGYHTESILCMPIFIRSTVIGVVQMVNKHGGPFTQIDEEAFETFANYCGLALHHAKLYDKIRRSEQKYRVSLEVLAYHSVCNRDEVNKLKKVQLRDKIPELDFFEFNGNRLSELEKPLYAVYMFRSLFNGVISFDPDDLVRFVLTVRKNYRKVPYHNWTHGWTVAHAMFVFLRRNKNFTALEKLSLFVAAICHDLDHRGKNNAYMKSMSTPLAAIYSTSVMEHHHFNQTVTILQQDGHNIFKSLQSDEYKEEGTLWDNKSHRALSQALLMTACDLIATAKPWKVQTETVKVIFEEFYEQGDAERMNGREPIPMMDRTKANELPQMQVGFMKGICIPCYEAIAPVIPEAEKLKERTLYNNSKWEQLAEEQNRLQALEGQLNGSNHKDQDSTQVNGK
ncbi:3'5'-cyclic nucleotide phosphodiesterase domain-containing protein [Ditylenchus destructor]|nr:3'5'-cyclic nucleotide phosphodiesterase domain-containing protein [Ditylenchus destructor]